MARHNEFRRPQDVHVKMPDAPAPAVDSALFGGAEPGDVEPGDVEPGDVEPGDVEPGEQADDYAALPEAPKKSDESHAFPYDGQPVFVTDAKGNHETASWRVTREWGGSAVRWTYTGFWVRWNSGGMKIHFAPTHYKRATL